MAGTTVRKTITLTEPQDQWVKAQITNGNYTNDSEYIRALIRREQEHSAEIHSIRGALIEGEESGTPESFDHDDFIRDMRATHG